MNIRKSFRPSLVILSLGALAAAGLSTPPASAAFVTWTGSGTAPTDLTSPGNWSTGALPSPTDVAVFPSTITTNQPTTQSNGGPTFGQYQLLTPTGGWTVGVNTPDQNTITGVSTMITATSSVNVGLNASTLTSGSDVINGDIRFQGTQDIWVGPRSGVSTGILVMNFGIQSVGVLSIAQIGDGTVQFNAPASTGTTANQSWLGSQYSVNDSGSIIINANDIFGTLSGSTVANTLFNWNSAGSITVLGNRVMDSNITNGGGTMNITGTLTVTGTDILGSGTRGYGLNGNLTLTGPMVGTSATVTFGMSYNGVSSGTGAVFNISGNNTYNGNTVIGNAGFATTVNATSNSAFSTGTVTVSSGGVIGTGTDNSSQTVTLANSLVVSDSMATSGVATLLFNGTTWLNGATGTTTLTNNNSSVTEFGGVIANANAGANSGKASTLVLNGGDVRLDAANTYSGATIINETGRLRLGSMGNAGAASSLGASSSAASNLVFNGSGLQILYYGSGTGSTNRLFTLNGNAITFDANGASMAFTNTGAIVEGAGTKTITLRNNSNSAASSSVMNPQLTDASGGVLNIIKLDAGTWTLGGMNTYTGSTMITAGTLLVSGSLGATAVTVSNTAAFGNGRAAGATGFSTLNVASLTMTGSSTGINGSKLLLNLGASGTSDRLGTTGAISITGGAINLVLTLDGVSDLSGSSYTLLTWGTTGITSTSQINLAGSSAQILADINTNNTWALQAGSNSLMLVAVPEPSTWALFGCGLAVAGWTWNRKRGRRQSTSG